MILPPEDVTRNRRSRNSRQKALERGQERRGKKRENKQVPAKPSEEPASEECSIFKTRERSRMSGRMFLAARPGAEETGRLEPVADVRQAGAVRSEQEPDFVKRRLRHRQLAPRVLDGQLGGQSQVPQRHHAYVGDGRIAGKRLDRERRQRLQLHLPVFHELFGPLDKLCGHVDAMRAIFLREPGQSQGQQQSEVDEQK